MILISISKKESEIKFILPSKRDSPNNYSTLKLGTRLWPLELTHRIFPPQVKIIIMLEDLLWTFSDEVWHRCGDTSTDYNHYTKRILFNAAYASTELHLLTDQSTDKFATW